MEVSASVQRDNEIQRELFQLKESFDEAVQCYEGEDPLEIWFEYILKVDECFTKNRGSGNLIPLLEECLSKFECDSRYCSDRRLCKLWIKYIDLQQNPVELFQLLHSKGICVSCADLYSAWALYHELAGDFKQASNVFQLGIMALAQPYEELVVNQNNMYMNAGMQVIHGVDERRLNDRRHTLTTLHLYKPNLQNLPGNSRAQSMAGAASNGSMASSVFLDELRSLENISQNNRSKQDSMNTLQVHAESKVDHRQSVNLSDGNTGSVPPRSTECIHLYPGFYSMNHDDFSNWLVERSFPEPHEPNSVPMYPKHIVYSETEEYSLEEIQARRYLVKKNEDRERQEQVKETVQENIDHHMSTETEQAVQSIMSNRDMSEQVSTPKTNMALRQSVLNYQVPVTESQGNYSRQSYYVNENTAQCDQDQSAYMSFIPKHAEVQHHMIKTASNFNRSDYQQKTSQNVVPNTQETDHQKWLNGSRNVEEKDNANASSVQWRNGIMVEESLTMKSVNDFWKDTLHESQIEIRKPVVQTFNIHEDTRILKDESIRQEVPPPISAVKTPFTILNHGSEEVIAKNARQFHRTENDGKRRTYNVAQDDENCIPNNENLQYSLYEDKGASSNQQNKPMRQAYDEMGLPPGPVQAETNSQSAYRKSVAIRPYLSQPVVEYPRQSPRQSHYSQPGGGGDDFLRPLEAKKPAIDGFTVFENAETITPSSFNDTCNTQIFNFDLTTLKTSTPFNYKKSVAQQFASELNKNDETETNKHIKQKLFVDNGEGVVQEKLSVILERTKEYSSSSGNSSVGTTLKMNTFNANSLKAIPEPSNMDNDSRLVNNTHLLKTYSQPQTPHQPHLPIHYSQIETKNYEPLQHSSMTYSLNNIQPNTSQNVAKNMLRTEPYNQSQRLGSFSNNAGNLMDQSTTHMYILSNQSASMSMPPTNVDNMQLPSQTRNDRNHMSEILTVNNQSHMGYSTPNVIENVQEHTNKHVTSRSSQHPGEQSYIYISDNDEPSKYVKSISNMVHIVESSAEPNSSQPQASAQSQNVNHAKLVRNQYSEQMSRSQESLPKSQGSELFYESSNDSNSLKDLWGRSPAKGSRMDVDVHSMSQNSNSELKMDYDSCPEPPSKTPDDMILAKTPTDPFSSKLLKALLNKVGFPNQKHVSNYVSLQALPRLCKKETICLGDERYLIANVIGKGTYGSVLKATRLSNNELVALKFQKPSNQWELYICNEIQHRANPYLLKAFMSVQMGFFCPSSSILISEFGRYGSLLDFSNKVKQVTGKGIKELVVIYFANEIVTIIDALHQCKIIHADIKPDNFLVMRMPPDFGHPCLQLIDFGCSIDMSLFPKDTTFTKVIHTENFTCTEMKDGRPWTYQTDIFCLAASVHVLLFEKYMQLKKRGDVWSINTRIPRYMRADLWNTFFFQTLNIESCDKLPDLATIKNSFGSILSEMSEELQVDIRYVANNVNGR